MNYEQIIDKLAAKLSVPAAHLWAILVRQARVEAISAVTCFGLLLLAIWIMAAVVTPRLMARCVKLDESGGDGAGWIAAGFVAWLAILIFTIVTGLGAYSAIGYFMNPEYYALQQILSAVK